MKTTELLTIEELLKERQWLARLCHRLVRDAADVDDVVQETMTRALAAPSATAAHASGRLQGWLATTGRNVAREMRRRAGRRVDRERQVARPESTSSDLDGLMAGAELREQLARLVMGLPQKEREAVVMRFYGDLSAEEIAERVGASSAGAVRQRIFRGLERLRDSLDAQGERDGRAAWIPVAIGLARQGQVSANAAAAGGGWMAVWGAVAAVLVALLGAAWWLWPKAAPSVVMEEALVSQAEPQGDHPDLVAIPEVREDQREGAGREVSVAVAPAGRRFRVLDPRTREPLEGTEWFLRRTGDQDPQPFGAMDGGYLPPIASMASGVTGPDGEIALPPVEDEILQLVLERGEKHAGTAFAIEGSQASGEVKDLVPVIGGALTGVFVDASGDPIAGAEVAEWTSEERLRPVGVTGADGGFRIDGVAPIARQYLPAGHASSGTVGGESDGNEVVWGAWRSSSCYFVRRSAGDRWAQIWNLREQDPPIPEGKVRSVGTVRALEPRRVSGVVLDGAGDPVPGAIVAEKRALRFVPQQRLREWTLPVAPWVNRSNSRVVTTGGDGRFELEVAPIGGRFRPGMLFMALGPDGSSTELPLPDRDEDGGGEPLTFVLDTTLAVPVKLVDPTRPGERLELVGRETHFVGWRALGEDGQPHPKVRLPRLTWMQGGNSISLERRWLKGTGSITLEVDVPGYDVGRINVSEGAEEVTLFLNRRRRTRLQVRFTGPHVLPGQTATVLVASEEPKTKRLPYLMTSPRQPPGPAFMAGGMAMAVEDGDTIEVAWPLDQRGWLVAYPNEAGPHVLNHPIAIGPTRIPPNDSTIELEVPPWTLYADGGKPRPDPTLATPLH